MMSARILSNIPFVFSGTWAHLRLATALGRFANWHCLGVVGRSGLWYSGQGGVC